MRAVGIIAVYLGSAAVSLAAIVAAVVHWGGAVLLFAAVLVLACAVPRRARGTVVLVAAGDGLQAPASTASQHTSVERGTSATIDAGHLEAAPSGAARHGVPS